MAEGSLDSLESEAGNKSPATKKQPFSTQLPPREQDSLPNQLEMKQRKPLPKCRAPLRGSQFCPPQGFENRVTKRKSPFRHFQICPPPGFEHLAAKGKSPLRRSQLCPPPGFKSRAAKQPSPLRFSQICPPPGFEHRDTEQNSLPNRSQTCSPPGLEDRATEQKIPIKAMLDKLGGKLNSTSTTKPCRPISVGEILLQGVAMDLGRRLRENPEEFDRLFPLELAGPEVDNVTMKNVSDCLPKPEKLANDFGYKTPRDPEEEEEEWYMSLENGTRRTVDQSQRLQSLLGLADGPQLKFEKLPDTDLRSLKPRCYDTPTAGYKLSSPSHEL
ncbi:hypothetical protein ISF_06730 [Cordyceps fumosorosea ARSEF 2679]|uniref:Uncharacterized protein n=1 Tax=Cordyceps fumosorosea (strain ARSEF 2679) TaxID=1081104 RepID=A0A167R1U4_CORFA|nr:hypothetical protein ISF_06730 [Cordyceps fumosorosea ARSEF 2679]OAA58191.1 hypothetical protein ISF_06730 [Cordyceps fumosorosea ARSEF 2679]